MCAVLSLLTLSIHQKMGPVSASFCVVPHFQRIGFKANTHTYTNAYKDVVFQVILQSHYIENER